MKKISLILVVAMMISLLAGCAGTTVVYHTDCTCPTGSHSAPATNPTNPSTPSISAEGEIKTGVFVGVTMKNTDYSGAVVDGMVEYDVTVAAVTVDENGVILSCRLDSIGTSLAFEGGALGIDPKDHPPILSKNELGDSYGMKGSSGIGAEWYQQAQALCDYAVGKTVEELRSGAVNESGYAADADLATSATIKLGGYVSAIEGAVANAKPLGAQAGDELRLAAISSFVDSTNPADGKDGNAQLNVDVVALTMNGETITSCQIDSIQAKVAFNAAGTVTSDLTAPVQSKNQLGDAYNMVAWGSATYEWYQQAENFSAYVTGKTAADVAGIAIAESTKPAEGTDLAATVTISIIGFQNLIAKAAA